GFLKLETARLGAASCRTAISFLRCGGGNVTSPCLLSTSSRFGAATASGGCGAGATTGDCAGGVSAARRGAFGGAEGKEVATGTVACWACAAQNGSTVASAAHSVRRHPWR